MTSDRRLWVKIGQDTRWRATDVIAYDGETFDVNTLYGYTPETSLQPSAPAAGQDAGKHGGSNTSLVVAVSIMGTVVAIAMIAVLILAAKRYRSGRQQYRPLDSRIGERSSLLAAGGGDASSYPPIGDDNEQA